MFLGFPCGSAGKESACNAGDPSSIPGLGRYPRKGKGCPLQYSGLEDSVDCSPWVAKRWTRLSDFCFHLEAQSQTHRVRIWIVTGPSGEAYAHLSLRNTVLNILLNNMLSTESQKMKFYFWFYFIKMKFYLFISNYRCISLVYSFINMIHSDWCPYEQVPTRAGDTVATCAPHLHWLLPGTTCLIFPQH